MITTIVLCVVGYLFGVVLFRVLLPQYERAFCYLVSDDPGDIPPALATIMSLSWPVMLPILLVAGVLVGAHRGLERGNRAITERLKRRAANVRDKIPQAVARKRGS